MRLVRRELAAVCAGLFLALVLAACGSSVTTTIPGTAEAAAVRSACSLFTTADAHAVFGGAVRQMAPDNPTPPPTKPALTQSFCGYAQLSPTVPPAWTVEVTEMWGTTAVQGFAGLQKQAVTTGNATNAGVRVTSIMLDGTKAYLLSYNPNKLLPELRPKGNADTSLIAKKHGVVIQVVYQGPSQIQASEAMIRILDQL